MATLEAAPDIAWGDRNHALICRLLYTLNKSPRLRPVLWPRVNDPDPGPTTPLKNEASLKLARMVFEYDDLHGDDYDEDPESYGKAVLVMVTNLHETYNNLMACKFLDKGRSEEIWLKDGSPILDGTELGLVWGSMINYYSLLRKLNGDHYPDSEDELEPKVIKGVKPKREVVSSSYSGTSRSSDLPEVLPRLWPVGDSTRKRTCPDPNDSSNGGGIDPTYREKIYREIGREKERRAEREYKKYMIDAHIRLAEIKSRSQR